TMPIINLGINYLDPSTSAFANSIWHSSTRWVNHRHQSYKAEFVYREVQVVCIKLEALRELIIRQSQVAESCNTQMVDVEPRVSTASRFFTKQFLRAMRLAVSVRHTWGQER
uniref:Uncharacterized protein n=1 Tax=Cyanistes caeruleus TaxID=156563 RepID=A0A8C0V2K5_CYACU